MVYDVAGDAILDRSSLHLHLGLGNKDGTSGRLTIRAKVLC